MDFLKDLKSRVLVAAGAWGTEVGRSRGFELTGNLAVWLLEHPDVFKEFFKTYLDSGSDIATVSVGASNRFRLKHFGRAEEAFRITRDLTRLGRQVCPPNCYLSGNISNLGHLLQPLGEVSYEEAYESYKEQALAMAEGGVDVVWVLTMTEIPATEAAIKAVKDTMKVPVMASMSFDATTKGARTIMGATPAEVAARLDGAGADVIGANCGGISPAQVTDVLKEMARATKKPLVAKPNAGKPEVIDGATVHPMSAEEMAAHVPAWIAAGARVVSGCCGAGPEHIARIAEAVRKAS